MDVRHADFIKSAVRATDYPVSELPEIAFAGRSNVGKSSLINVLVNRKNLVRASSTPGRTQLINFFDVDGRLVLVDLPGYGYAKAPPEVRRQWGPMIETYLSSRPNLKAVVLILDIRRTPSRGDLDMLGWLESYGIPPIIVLTKCDKLTRNARARQTGVIAAAVQRDRGLLLPFSALSREGRERIWEEIERLAVITPPSLPLSGEG
jgi:GTP-binding protein